MADDDMEELERRLDLLASYFRRRVGGVGFAETLIATANGILALEGVQPRWLADEGVVALPFADTETLEESLEDFLTHKALCVPVEGVPLWEDVTLRVIAGPESVDLDARSVQQTSAGVVFQITTDDVQKQKSLIQLPGVLRSNPRKSEVKRDRVRIPTLVPESQAEERLQRPLKPPVDLPGAEDSFAELAADTPHETGNHGTPRQTRGRVASAEKPLTEAQVTQRIDRSSHRGSNGPSGRDRSGRSKRAPARETQRIDETHPIGSGSARDSRSTRNAAASNVASPRVTQSFGDAGRSQAARTGLRKSTIDAAELRLRSDNMFEVLGIHFSANEGDILEARDELLEMLEPQSHDDDAMCERLDRLRAGIRKAAGILVDPKTRQQHRDEVVDGFQLDSAIEMYFRRAETAKIRDNAKEALEAYERVLEMVPDDRYARSEIAKIKRGEFD